MYMMFPHCSCFPVPWTSSGTVQAPPIEDQREYRARGSTSPIGQECWSPGTNSTLSHTLMCSDTGMPLLLRFLICSGVTLRRVPVGQVRFPYIKTRGTGMDEKRSTTPQKAKRVPFYVFVKVLELCWWRDPKEF